MKSFKLVFTLGASIATTATFCTMTNCRVLAATITVPVTDMWSTDMVVAGNPPSLTIIDPDPKVPGDDYTQVTDFNWIVVPTIMSTMKTLTYDPETQYIKKENTLKNLPPVTKIIRTETLFTWDAVTMSWIKDTSVDVKKTFQPLLESHMVFSVASIPEPSNIIGITGITALGLGATLKRKLKPSKLSEKETTTVS